jgi:hypothetical protein
MVAQAERVRPWQQSSSRIACTLSAGDLRDRLAWITALNRDALRGYDRPDPTLRLRYTPQAAQQVRELMR